MGSGGDTGGDESGDGDDQDDDDGEAGEVKSNEVVPKADGHDMESVEVDGYDMDVEGVHVHTLAYHMEGHHIPLHAKGHPGPRDPTWNQLLLPNLSQNPLLMSSQLFENLSTLNELHLSKLCLIVWWPLTYFMTTICCFQFHCRQAMAERRIFCDGAAFGRIMVIR